MSFSVVIIAKNEAHIIGRTLEALLPLKKEILLVDSGSTDGTCDIAQSLGVKVLEMDWEGFAATKNKGNQAAQQDWILSIDADEVLSDDLCDQLMKWQPKKQTVFLLDRITEYRGAWIRHSGWYPDWKPRLFDRRFCRWEGSHVHETLVFPGHFKREKLRGKLWHYSYKNREDHLRRMERYTELSARKMFEKGKKGNLLRACFSAGARFVRSFLIKKGFLDGHRGLDIARMNAKMVFLKYKKLMALQKDAAQSSPIK
jgi:glycosyltransferase involved in cell wall biosynthesis